MKVYNLSIDSSERQTNLYSYANNYVVTLENPIYDVSQIKLISGRIPTPQLASSATNKTFSVDGNVFILNETNYANGYVLAEDLETVLAPPDSNISLVVYDEETQALNFSNVGNSNAFTLEFQSGTNGYQNTSSLVTMAADHAGLRAGRSRLSRHHAERRLGALSRCHAGDSRLRI